jgi:hypothetical protein
LGCFVSIFFTNISINRSFYVIYNLLGRISGLGAL